MSLKKDDPVTLCRQYWMQDINNMISHLLVLTPIYSYDYISIYSYGS